MMIPKGLAITANTIVLATCAIAVADDAFITTEDWGQLVAFLDMLEKRPGLLSMIGAVLATLAAGGGAIAGGVIGANKHAKHTKDAEFRHLKRERLFIMRGLAEELVSAIQVLAVILNPKRDGEDNVYLKEYPAIHFGDFDQLSLVYRSLTDKLGLLPADALRYVVGAHSNLSGLHRIHNVLTARPDVQRGISIEQIGLALMASISAYESLEGDMQIILDEISILKDLHDANVFGKKLTEDITCWFDLVS